MALKYRAYIIKSCSDNLQYFSLRFLVSLFETFALLFVRHRGSAQASGLNGMKRVTILYSHNQIFAYTKMHKKTERWLAEKRCLRQSSRAVGVGLALIGNPSSHQKRRRRVHE